MDTYADFPIDWMISHLSKIVFFNRNHDMIHLEPERGHPALAPGNANHAGLKPVFVLDSRRIK